MFQVEFSNVGGSLPSNFQTLDEAKEAGKRAGFEFRVLKHDSAPQPEWDAAGWRPNKFSAPRLVGWWTVFGGWHDR